MGGADGVNKWSETGAERGASDTIVPWRLSVWWRTAERCSGGGPSKLVKVLGLLLVLVPMVG